MQGGFSFCGTDIAKLGLEYVPMLNDTYVFAGSAYDVHQESFDAHHGGYFYGTTVQPKDFVLRCFYEDKHIAHGTLSTIEGFFRRGKTGRLIFSTMPWLWYTATVVDIDMSDIRNYRNGFVTITLRAFYPFARHDHISLNSTNINMPYIRENSGLMDEGITPPSMFTNVTSDRSILLYNGGSDYASVAIELAGDAGEGVIIANHTTNQEARFIAFTVQETSNAGKYIVSDSLNGKTVLTDGTTSHLNCLYHDYGFINLAPSFPIDREISFTCTNGSTLLQTQEKASDEWLNKFIYIDNSWRKITDIRSNGVVISSASSSSGVIQSDIVTMNEIDVSLSHGASLTKLNFLYKPTFH